VISKRPRADSAPALGFLAGKAWSGVAELAESGGTRTGKRMKHEAIISRAESLQILKNDLRRAALEKRVAVPSWRSN